MVRVLRAAQLIDADDAWVGETATLWFLGDFFDRGPDGIACIDLIMRLQQEAAAAGGSVQALLGNHEPLLLAAHRFGQQPANQRATMFVMNWVHNGGILRDLERLTPEHVAWLAGLPAMARVQDRLLIHADSLLYATYGNTIEAVNRAIAAILRGDDACAWDTLLLRFTQRFAFTDELPARYRDRQEDDGRTGIQRARDLLRTFGGQQVIHGHTPIHYITEQPAEQITSPLVYADGLCVNVDGGMYLGGPGFLYEVPPLG